VGFGVLLCGVVLLCKKEEGVKIFVSLLEKRTAFCPDLLAREGHHPQRRTEKGTPFH
jgi:hypothetical protein